MESLTGSAPSASTVSRVFHRVKGVPPCQGCSTVSRVFHTLGGEYQAWKNHPLCERYEYIFADGTYFTVIYEGEGCKMPILLVIGIKPDGVREVLGFSVGDRENQRAWEGVLEDLKARGVKEVGMNWRSQEADH